MATHTYKSVHQPQGTCSLSPNEAAEGGRDGGWDSCEPFTYTHARTRALALVMGWVGGG